MPVGYEIATALRAPLDVFLVRKLGVPSREELAMGAIASGGVVVINEDVVRGFEISPQVIQDLEKVWSQVKGSGVRALVIASSNPFLFSAGADIKAFTTMDESSGEQLINTAHALFKELGSDGVDVIGRVAQLSGQAERT